MYVTHVVTFVTCFCLAIAAIGNLCSNKSLCVCAIELAARAPVSQPDRKTDTHILDLNINF